MSIHSLSHVSRTIKTELLAFLDDLESLVIASASKLAPLVVPAGPAWLIMQSLVEVLHVPDTAAIIMGVAVELAGISSTHLATRCFAWNLSKRKTDSRAPFALAVWLSVGYLVCGVSLSVILKVIPGFAVWSPVVFFAMAGISYVAMALHLQLTKWQNDRQEENTTRQTMRQLRHEIATLQKRNDNLSQQVTTLKARKNTTLSSVPSEKSNGDLRHARKAKKLKADERREKVLELTRQDMTQSDIAKELGVSLRTINRDIQELNGSVMAVTS